MGINSGFKGLTLAPPDSRSRLRGIRMALFLCPVGANLTVNLVRKYYCRPDIRYKNIINHSKSQRLSWFGHIQRMPDTRTIKKIFNWKPVTKRLQGRPRYRWEDKITQDICQIKIKNWVACVQVRGK